MADKMDPVRSKFGTIEKEEVTLSDKMSYVEEYAMLNGYFSFRQLLARQRSKMHVIVTFLAVLELMKVGKIQITQAKNICGDYDHFYDVAWQKRSEALKKEKLYDNKKGTDSVERKLRRNC